VQSSFVRNSVGGFAGTEKIRGEGAKKHRNRERGKMKKICPFIFIFFYHLLQAYFIFHMGVCTKYMFSFRPSFFLYVSSSF
jgi:hypothetical protein